MNQKVCFVTSQKSVYHEVDDFLQRKSAPIDLEFVEMDLFEIQTRDQRAIALHKAEWAWDRLERPLIVEDSGLYLEKYGSFPGTLTNHVFKGIGYRGIFRLVDSGDRAVFIINQVFVDNYGNNHLFEGRFEGKVVKPHNIEINEELPFDRIFVPNGCDRPYSEIKKDFKEYDKFSYRTESMNKFLEWYKHHVGHAKK